MHNRVVVLEHVHFVNVGQRLNAELLHGRFQLLVFADSFVRDNLLCPSLSTLASELGAVFITSRKSGTSIFYLLVHYLKYIMDKESYLLRMATAANKQVTN